MPGVLHVKQLLRLAGVLLLLSGCASKLEPIDEDIVTVPEIGDKTPVVENKAILSSKNPPVTVPDDKYFGLWWRHLGNAELEMLIDRALVNNQQLQIAAQRIVQAKARSIQSQAATLPTVTAMAGYTADAPEGGIGSVPKGSTPQASDEFEVGLNARYTVDLWGERASFSEAAKFRMQQAIYQYDAQLLQLITDLAKSYLEYLSLNDRIRNAEESEKALTSMLGAMEELYERGDATVVEMQIQRSSVFNARVVLPTLQLSRDQLENRIARFVGVAPGELTLSSNGLSSLSFPEKITGISSSYILRRPDIQGIESALLAADADLDVARKAVLPALDLAANVGYGSAKLTDLFQPHTLIWSFIANLTTSVFDGGAQEQEIKFAQSVRSELIETYVFNVYSGMQQAKDALYEIDYTDQRLQMQRKSTQAAKKAQDFGLEAYSVGGIDFLTFLDSIHSYRKRRDELYTFNLEYYQAFIDLYGALGGGIPYRGATPEKWKDKAIAKALNEAEALNDTGTNFWHKEELGWFDKPKEYQDKESWAVRLPGVYDAFATESVLKDFKRRYVSLAPAKGLLAERIGFDNQERDNKSSWYALVITGFEEKKQAEIWCSMLRKTQQRCIVYMPDESIEVDGAFLIDSTHQHSLHPNRETIIKNSAPVIVRKKADHQLGPLYSLLKSDGTHAWLIGNRTFRVWKFKVGAELHENGRIIALKKDQAILRFNNNGVRLVPLYTVDAIEKGKDGLLLAYMRWGNRTGKRYIYKTGDKVYGGTVKSIDASGVTVAWGAYNIHLKVAE